MSALARPDVRRRLRGRLGELRAPAVRDPRLPGPAVMLGVAALVLVASLVADSGGGLGGTAVVEIVLVLLGGGLTAAAVARSPDGAPAGGWTLLALAALAVLTGLSVLWAVDPNSAWVEANRTLAYLAAFAGAAGLARLAPGRGGAMAGGLLLGMALVCLFALTSKVVPEWLSETERFARLREPFGYWNSIGLAGALVVPAALWLGARRDGRPLVDALAYPTVALGVLTMLLAYSRGSLLAAAIGAVVWFALTRRRVRSAAVLLVGTAAAAFVAAWTFGQDALTEDGAELAARGSAGRELLVLLVGVALLTYLAGLALAFIADLRPLSARQRRHVGISLLCLLALTPAAAAGALQTTDDGLGGSISTAWETLTDPDAQPPSNEPGRLTETGSIRARYWDDAFRMLEARRVAGHGAGAYGVLRTRYREDTIDVRHAHGYIPQTLADLGFLGLGLSLLALVAFTLAARTALRRTAGPQRAALVGILGVATVFGAHSIVDFTWFTPGTAVAGLLAAGWLAGVTSRRPEVPVEPRPGLLARVPVAIAAVVALLALALAWSAWQPLRAERAADTALDRAASRELDDARESAETGADANPLSAEPLLALATVERRAGDDDAAERALQEAVERQPAVFTTWLRLAEFQLFVRDRPDDALQSVRAAVYLNPNSYTVIQRFLDVRRTQQGRGSGR